MKKAVYWGGVIWGCLWLFSSGCTVKQQQEVLGSIGRVIPGSSNSMFGSGSSSSSSASGSQAPASSPAAAATPAPRVDPDRVDAQLVLRTMQRVMTDNPASFQECLENSECRSAFAAHIIRLQKQAMSTIELPPAYDRYDLQRGRE